MEGKLGAMCMLRGLVSTAHHDGQKALRLAQSVVLHALPTMHQCMEVQEPTGVCGGIQ